MGLYEDTTANRSGLYSTPYVAQNPAKTLYIEPLQQPPNSRIRNLHTGTHNLVLGSSICGPPKGALNFRKSSFRRLKALPREPN